MKPEENVARLRGAQRLRGVFIQPFAILLVSAVFLILIIAMGLTDIQRSERMMIGFIDDQGRRVIGVVEKLTEENLRNMIDASQRTTPGSSFLLKNTIFSPDRLLTQKIVDMGAEIDNHWKKEHISDSYVKEFAQRNNLWLLAVLNPQNELIFQSRIISEDISAEEPEGKTRQTTGELLRILNSLNRQNKIGFIALSRKKKEGTIVLALDRESMRYWGMRVSVEKAIEKLGEGRGLLYLSIHDTKGHYLGSIGSFSPPGHNETLSEKAKGPPPVRFESRKIVYGTNSIQEIAAPFYLGQEVAGHVLLGIDRGNTDRILTENRKNVYLFLAFVVVITLLSLFLLYHNQNRHLARVVEMTRQLEKAERLSSLGMLAAGVAHEIRNPLNAISMASQRLKREFAPTEEGKKRDFDSIASVIRDEIRRLNGIIEEFLTFSKSRRLELRENSVQDILQKIARLMSAEAAERGVTIRTEWPDNPLLIPMDMDKLQQALLNFVKNAMESISGAGEVTLTLQAEDRKLVKIEIADTGCGMTPEEIERIFNPEYTTKEKGLGLGLSLAHEIIRGHGGEILVKSKKGEGTIFEIYMPRQKSGRQGE